MIILQLLQTQIKSSKACADSVTFSDSFSLFKVRYFLFQMACFIVICSGTVLAYPMNPLIGEPMLPMSGQTLSKKNIEMPAYFQSKPTFIAFGFSRKCQEDFESWIKPFRRQYKDTEDVFYMEIPMLGPAFKIGRRFIDRGMRSGIHEPLHDHTVTFYGPTESYKTYYGFTNKKTGYFIVVDQSGIIRWQSHGRATTESFQEMVDVMEILRKGNTHDG